MNYDKLKSKYREYHEVMKTYYRTIINNGRNEKKVKETLIDMYIFLKEIAPVFCKKLDYSANYYFRLLEKDAFDIEQIVHNFYIMPTSPTFTYSKEKTEKPNTDDSEIILDWLVHKARQRRSERVIWSKEWTIEHLSFENECVSLSKEIKEICLENDIECEIKRINPGFEKTARLYDGVKFHDFCIVTLYGEKYLVDCTYRQFFLLQRNCLECIGIPYMSGANPGIFMSQNEERKNVASTVLQRGWVPLTGQYVKHYFDGFALSFRNGHFYEDTKDLSFTTPYDADDYMRFLNGEDTQVNHEGVKALSLQRVSCRNDYIK